MCLETLKRLPSVSICRCESENHEARIEIRVQKTWQLLTQFHHVQPCKVKTEWPELLVIFTTWSAASIENGISSRLLHLNILSIVKIRATASNADDTKSLLFRLELCKDYKRSGALGSSP
jgi:hypothetical protein